MVSLSLFLFLFLSLTSIDPSLNLSPEWGETCDEVYVYDIQVIKNHSHFRGGVGEG